MSHAGSDHGPDELLIPLARLTFMRWYLISSLVMSLAGFLLYYYYFRKGQFEDAEDVKYQLFRDDDNNLEDVDQGQMR